MKMTIQIPVADIAEDLKNGISDEELMEKYGLSEKGLKRLFDKFLRAMSNGSSHIRMEVKQ